MHRLVKMFLFFSFIYLCSVGSLSAFYVIDCQMIITPIEPSQIFMKEQEYYMLDKTNLIPIKGFIYDHQATFAIIELSGLEQKGSPRSTWECKNCGYINYDGINNCGVCGHSRY
jgi:hypothetical protein